MRWSVGHDRPSVHNHGVPTGAAAAFMMRPTTAPSQSTSKSSSFHSPEGRDAERTDRLGGGLQQNLAALFREIHLGFRREMHIAHLARAKNELLAAPLEDELRFGFR
jgi:hypothetical protein